MKFIIALRLFLSAGVHFKLQLCSGQDWSAAQKNGSIKLNPLNGWLTYNGLISSVMTIPRAMALPTAPVALCRQNLAGH